MAPHLLPDRDLPITQGKSLVFSSLYIGQGASPVKRWVAPLSRAPLSGMSNRLGQAAPPPRGLRHEGRAAGTHHCDEASGSSDERCRHGLPKAAADKTS